VIIDRNKRFIFIHIPRTGGSTLSGLLTHLNDEEYSSLVARNYKQYFDTGHPDIHNNHHSHATMDWFPKTKPSDYNDYSEIFCFVRNPWDRFRSVYLNMLNAQLSVIHMYEAEARHRGETLAVSTTLSTFGNFINTVYKENLSHRSRYSDFQIHEIVSQPQSHWYNHPAITHVYRFENYEENVKAILEKYSFTETWKSTVPHVNKGIVKYEYNYDLTYTSEMLEKVAYIETDTIKKFGYNF
tara:strand:- start:877 stop:1599 length:723 start_codon:yes stop_codon:yes gene_type:complete